jgi:hypothetical protein
MLLCAPGMSQPVMACLSLVRARHMAHAEQIKAHGIIYSDVQHPELVSMRAWADGAGAKETCRGDVRE